MSVIGDASAQVAHALRGLAMRMLSHKRQAEADAAKDDADKVDEDKVPAFSLDLDVERYSLLVSIKAPTQTERIKKWPDAVAHALLRVDVMAAGRLGLLQGQELDRWLGKQEEAVGALVAPFDDYAPPWPSHRLRPNMVQPKDPWVGHMFTKDRFRYSLWLVEQ